MELDLFSINNLILLIIEIKNAGFFYTYLVFHIFKSKIYILAWNSRFNNYNFTVKKYDGCCVKHFFKKLVIFSAHFHTLLGKIT